MATTISTQDIVDAKRDIDDIGKAVNEKVIVSPRYGEDFKSLPMIAEEFQDAIETAAAAGAGANGWTDLLIQTADGSTQRAKNASFQTQINSKADTSDVAAALALKANQTYVDSQDASLQSQIDQKATSAYLDAALDEQTQTVNTALSQLSTQASKFYPTLAAANADIANIEVNQPVQIGESGANGGLWYKATAGATSLTKSPYDPLTQAKNYADSNPLFKPVTLTGTENLDTLPQGTYSIPTAEVATALDSQLPATATAPKLGFIKKTYLNVSIVELEFTRYTQNSSGEYEVFRKTSNGGSSILTWLDWKKDASRKDIDNLKESLSNKPDVNLFKHLDLSASDSYLYQSTTSLVDGNYILSMNNNAVSQTVYEYQADDVYFKPGKTLTFSAENFCDLTGVNGGDLSVQYVNAAGTQIMLTASSRTSRANEWHRLTNTSVIPAGTSKIRLRFSRRGGTVCQFRSVRLLVDDIGLTVFNPSLFLKNSPIVFVSKSGNDSNKGTLASPFLTIQRAVNFIEASGSPVSIITILDSGEYRETVTIANRNHVILQHNKNQRAKIFGSDQLVVSKSTGFNKVYQAPLTSKPTGMGGERGKPMIAEWGTPSSPILNEDRHPLQNGATHRLPYTEMHEATSLAELDTPSGNGKWWWELGVIYFAATDGSDASLKRYEARVRPCLIHSLGTIELRGVDCYFSSNYNFAFYGISTKREDCRSYGAQADGIRDNANSTYSLRDISIGSGNDNINGTVTTYTGEDALNSINATLIDPYCALSGDDGISFHIRGRCDIEGGLTEYNTKAGVVHVTGGGGVCRGTISRGQTNGFYTATEAPDGRVKSSMACHNTIAEKNTYDYRAADDADLYCVGTYSDNPTGYGYYQTGAGRIVCKDAKYRGDPAKIKSGNVIVETYTQVT